MKNFSGKVLFLDRSDINTDEIIPARYLTEITKEALKPHLLDDLSLEGFVPARDVPMASIVVSRANFGCGSSREHAPWAFEVNDIHVVIAENFARIFKQNMFNCGMLAIELPPAELDYLFENFSGKDTTLETDLENKQLLFRCAEEEKMFTFEISGFDEALVEADGWVGYANANY